MAWQTEAPQASAPAASWAQPAPPPVIPTMGRDELILAWKEKQAALIKAGLEEISFRNQLLALCFPGGKEGTENLDLGKGWVLKGVFKQNYSLDKDDEKVDKALTRLEKCGENGKFVAERVVKWKSELSVSEWRKLTPEQQACLTEVLTIKPGQPSLELVPPKEK